MNPLPQVSMPALPTVNMTEWAQYVGPDGKPFYSAVIVAHNVRKAPDSSVMARMTITESDLRACDEATLLALMQLKLSVAVNELIAAMTERPSLHVVQDAGPSAS